MTVHLAGLGTAPPPSWLSSVVEPDVAYGLSWPAPASCALLAGAGSAGVARRFTLTTLNEWGLPQVVDDVRLVVSELVTNALRHGLHGQQSSLLPPVQLRLVSQNRTVACAVRDPSDRAPAMCTTIIRDFAESGRGLQLVEALSQAWGWTVRQGRGKVVWAVFDVPRD